MKTQEVYQLIQEHKRQGHSRYRTEKETGIAKRTITKYWKMSPDEYEAVRKASKTRAKRSDQYHDEVLECLQKHPYIGTEKLAEMICIMRGVESLGVPRSTFADYVRNIRKEYNIIKPDAATLVAELSSKESGSIRQRLEKNKRSIPHSHSTQNKRSSSLNPLI